MLDTPYHIGLVIRKTAFVAFANLINKDVFVDTEFATSNDECMFLVWCGAETCKPIYAAILDSLIYNDFHMISIGYEDSLEIYASVDERGDPELNTFGCSAGITYDCVKDCTEEV